MIYCFLVHERNEETGDKKERKKWKVEEKRK
jgi:hypothetical protein